MSDCGVENPWLNESPFLGKFLNLIVEMVPLL